MAVAKVNTVFGSVVHGVVYGFHEDGLQAGLTVAEALGQVHRPLADRSNE